MNPVRGSAFSDVRSFQYSLIGSQNSRSPSSYALPFWTSSWPAPSYWYQSLS